jgi:uncharacterized protein (TIGR03435 family)
MKYSVVAAAAFSCAASGQSFEAASVKAAPLSNAPLRSSMRGGPGTADPGQITYTNVTLSAVIQRAYDVKPYQVTGADWLSSQRYSLVAKLPPGATKEQFGLMLQNLLAERFQLALHRQTEELPGFELAVGKNGAKLKPSTDSDTGPAPEQTSPPKTDANGFPQLDHPGLAMMEGVRGRAVISFLTARAQPLASLVEMLSKEFRLPLLDRTGLTGRFDFTLEFAPQPPGTLTPTAAEDSGPDLSSAVQQQLGLKLNPAKVPVDVLIVDRANQTPSGN